MRPDLLPIVLLAILLAACGTSEPGDAYAGRATGSYTAQLVGSGFEAHEGKTLHLVTWAEPACRAEGQSRISAGAFEVNVENRFEREAYPLIGAFIDLGDDGRCDPGVDPSWDAVGNVAGMSWTLSASEFTPFDPARPCLHFGPEE